MARLGSKIILAASLVALGACAKKAPEQLPPPPATEQPDTGDQSGVGTAPVPGSQADFIAKVSSDKIFFGLDQFDIDAEDQATLSSQAQWLQQYPNVRVTIEGHADERGTREYNLALGERRANAAKNYLASLGIPASRISVISYGKERPEALGSDEASWARNRRAVTVTVQ
ncbi:peptidoglycan-associated lipoprotein Pal [Sphingomonas sp. LaA6.9]|uniref:peptidoglycan-associated lipoprotein Pal n=1 Tax=Sphingomonas sp. LaA6.9 TaxID=2919914 RepID=UPI001F4FE382|nr:peptidoglycan-associated lipoprotein Pal [Sphingomonas sp. LaA6.9]MCJ8158494.1 peptidoglycan-associated lipoprotein Pal [Sphingomonas sp. LaA6.9]